MNTWVSNARYGQETMEGSIFELKNNPLRITIHHIHGCGNNWYLNCVALNISNVHLSTDDFSVAVDKAKDIIMDQVEKIVDSANSFYKESENEFTRY